MGRQSKLPPWLGPGAGILFALLAGFGCGSTGPDDESGGPESPIGYLIRFATAYTMRDSTAYAALLDSAYVFEALPAGDEPDDSAATLDRAEELRAAGNMFEKREDPGGRSLRDIDLRFILKGSAIDETVYPGKPEGETWIRIVAFTDLLVVVNDPSDPRGFFPVTVASDQYFVVRRDAVSGRFVTVRQIDRPSPGAAAGAVPNEAGTASWTGVKEFFGW